MNNDYTEKKIFLSEPGLICCAGKNKEELYQACVTGNQSGIIMKHIEGAGDFPTGIINEKSHLRSEGVRNEEFEFTNTKIHRLIDAALEQIRPLIEEAIAFYGSDKIGVCLGTCDNGSEGSLSAHREYLKRGAFPANYNLHHQSAVLPAQYAADKFSLKGPVMTIATACSSGASAIIRGAQLIKAGLCGAVIAGGADVVSDTVLMGFHALEAVSDSITNPFSKNRKGINLGEGAAFFLLDSRPGSNGIELLGYGESSDAYHMTAPGTDGSGPVKAITSALTSAGLESGKIDYVNLHGTGTHLNDISESLAMKEIFGGRAVPSSSTKPITGHTLGAAGAIETAVCWMLLRENKGYPSHVWDGVIDEELVFTPSSPPQSKPCSICMNNNFAFGGCNTSLIIGRKNF